MKGFRVSRVLGFRVFRDVRVIGYLGLRVFPEFV
jgi:hypothetical protein